MSTPSSSLSLCGPLHSTTLFCCLRLITCSVFPLSPQKYKTWSQPQSRQPTTTTGNGKVYHRRQGGKGLPIQQVSESLVFRRRSHIPHHLSCVVFLTGDFSWFMTRSSVWDGFTRLDRNEKRACSMMCHSSPVPLCSGIMNKRHC